ncbi:hypothetical protein AL036_11035 [Salipiger aestuarii]|uniref:Putative membrane protein n=1 Tax=Salipiger aestuarii TaxID=568098 RepID=A0A327Y8Z2_9RHOB|nr:periplasmic heavy metal sensor [Salipiger aestuarii]KAA8607416.1 hypothetical protein AL036_11035 [Salipiger aestuarii]KAA8612098.1 hypothetical protein AL037_08355 [Salipiger aestuarii]KAB2541731.1 hypothetical protein AL035_10550 [Salipiger aestuarii]RAK17274.1 putative membrane protein [Salipiger aestuarii]
MTDESKTKPGMSIGLRALLFGSLALNLAVVGIGLGVVLNRPDVGHHALRGRNYAFGYTGAFTDRQRSEFGTMLRGSFDGSRERDGAPDFLADYREALALLRQDPFDRAAFNDAVLRQDARAEARQARGRALMVGFIADFPPDERRAYADRLEHRISDMARRMKNHGNR